MINLPTQQPEDGMKNGKVNTATRRAFLKRALAASAGMMTGMKCMDMLDQLNASAKGYYGMFDNFRESLSHHVPLLK
jgi:hypothetical protein